MECNTNFSRLIQALYKGLGGNNQAEFTRMILEKATTDDFYNELADIRDNTLYKYYSGERNITRRAGTIKEHFDEDKFITFFENYSGTAMQDVCDLLQEEIPNMVASNAPEKLALHFKEILIEAMGSGKKNKKVSTPTAAQSETVNKQNSIKLITDSAFEKLDEFEQFEAFYNTCSDVIRNAYMMDILDKNTPMSLREDVKTQLYLWKTKLFDVINPGLQASISDVLHCFKRYLALTSSTRLPYFREIGEEACGRLGFCEDSDIYYEMSNGLYYLRDNIRSAYIRVGEVGAAMRCISFDTETVPRVY